MNTKKLIAHRGDNTNHPENSLAGIESALKAGAIYIEFDIQMNLDGTLIVLHDDDFNRTAGKNLSLLEANNHALKHISVHEPVRFANKHEPTPVPRLSEVMQLFSQYPEATAFIELKEQSINKWGVNKIMSELARVLANYQSQSVLISFNADTIRFAKEKCKVRTGFVFDHYTETVQKIAKQLKPDFMICPYSLLTKEPLWKGNWQWVVYVINDINVAKSLLQRDDLDLIETDNIKLFLED